MKTYCCACHDYLGKRMDCCEPRYNCGEHGDALDRWEAEAKIEINIPEQLIQTKLFIKEQDNKILVLIDLVRKKDECLQLILSESTNLIFIEKSSIPSFNSIAAYAREALDFTK